MVEWTVDVFRFGFIAWFAALLLIIVLNILQGRMSVVGILSGDGQRIHPERVQALAVFLIVISAYLLEGLAAIEDMPVQVAKGLDPKMPDISETLLVLLTGSNGLYLAGKIAEKHGVTS